MNRLDSRTIANRENALKSTGPRTEDGKARSRANAFQHGLAGAGVAWPGEMEGEMEAFVDRQLAAEPVPPRDAKEAFLLERIARLAWQVDRVERAEEAHAVIRAANAREAEEGRRDRDVLRLIALMESEPGLAVRGLLRTKAGCRWVVDALREMIDAVDADWWLASLDTRFDALCAPAQPGRLRISRAKALVLAIGSAEYGAVWPNGLPGDDPDSDHADRSAREWTRMRAEAARRERPRWRAELKDILTRRLEEVQLRHDELEERPDPALELAGLASTFDPSLEPERLRRHIRSRERERERLVRELQIHRAQRAEAIAAGMLEPEARVEVEPAVESRPEAESPPPAPGPPAAPKPLTPFAPAADSVRNDEGYDLHSPEVAKKWLRPGEIEADRLGQPFDRRQPDARP